MRSFSFPKRERLRARKDISALFEQQDSLFLYPFKLYYRQPNGLEHPRVLVSVSKRHFKRAVDRNLLKRRIREAYRLYPRRTELENYDLAFVYIAKEVVNYHFIREKLSSLLDRLV